MTAITFRAAWTPSDHDRLLSLMDLLTAVQMDLSPLCGHHKWGSLKPPEAAVAEACELLHTAIDDLRGVIGRLDGMADRDETDQSLDGRQEVQATSRTLGTP